MHAHVYTVSSRVGQWFYFILGYVVDNTRFLEITSRRDVNFVALTGRVEKFRADCGSSCRARTAMRSLAVHLVN